MKIEVQVKPNARKENVEIVGGGVYRVSVNAPPQDGKANEAVIELLARYFNVRKTAITILRGHSGRRKLVEVEKQ